MPFHFVCHFCPSAPSFAFRARPIQLKLRTSRLLLKSKILSAAHFNAIDQFVVIVFEIYVSWQRKVQWELYWLPQCLRNCQLRIVNIIKWRTFSFAELFGFHLHIILFDWHFPCSGRRVSITLHADEPILKSFSYPRPPSPHVEQR